MEMKRHINFKLKLMEINNIKEIIKNIRILTFLKQK